MLCLPGAHERQARRSVRGTAVPTRPDMAAAAKKPGICSLIVEALVFFCSSVPIMLVDFSCLLLVTLTIMYVSRTSSTAAFAGASLGSLCFNVAGNMIAAAPLAAMDTVAPQAFGAGDVTGVGLAAQRCLILAVIFLLPTMPLWLLAEEILLAFGQPADVSSYAATYMRLLVPGLLPYTAFQCARKFLYAQEHASRLPPLLASVVGLACHVGWLELWCHETSLGIAHGAPVALSCTYTTMAVFLVGYICLRMPRAAAAWPRGAHTWQLLWADWAAWRHFTVTALAALASLTEWLFWEFTAFRVGRMGAVPFAAYSVAYSLEPVLFMLPLGLSTALSNAIGNHLGAGRVRAAKQLAAAALVLGALVVGWPTRLAHSWPIASRWPLPRACYLRLRMHARCYHAVLPAPSDAPARYHALRWGCTCPCSPSWALPSQRSSRQTRLCSARRATCGPRSAASSPYPGPLP